MAGLQNCGILVMYPVEIFEASEEVARITSEVIPDYQFYLKMYAAHQKMDFETQQLIEGRPYNHSLYHPDSISMPLINIF